MSRVVFCVPDWDEFSSGANIYNRRIWSVLKGEFPDIYDLIHEPKRLKGKAFDRVILDSLFLDSLSVSVLDEIKFILIGHFLKSFRPALYSDKALTRERRFLEAMEGIICTGPTTLKRIREISPAYRCTLIKPGMDKSISNQSIKSSPELPLRVLITTNLVREKDILSFLYGFENYWKEHSIPCTTEIEIIGDKSIQTTYAEECLEIISTLQERGLDIRYHKPYPQDRYLQILKQADLYVHPALRESYGMSIVEAAQAGVPVLCFHDANTSAVIEDGLNGFVCATSEELFEKWWQLMSYVNQGREWPFERKPPQLLPSWEEQAYQLHKFTEKLLLS